MSLIRHWNVIQLGTFFVLVNRLYIRNTNRNIIHADADCQSNNRQHMFPLNRKVHCWHHKPPTRHKHWTKIGNSFLNPDLFFFFSINFWSHSRWFLCELNGVTTPNNRLTKTDDLIYLSRLDIEMFAVVNTQSEIKIQSYQCLIDEFYSIFFPNFATVEC